MYGLQKPLSWSLGALQLCWPGGCGLKGSFNLAHVPQQWDIGLLAFPLGAFLLSCVYCDGLGMGRKLIFMATCLWCPKAMRDAGGRAGMVQRNILHPTGAVVEFILPGGDSFS